MKLYSTHTLSNGVRVLYHHTPSPVLHVSWGVAAGSAQDRVFGTAHFCEHLMFTGTHKRPDYDGELLSLGATNNAWTDHNRTVYEIEAPPNTLLEILEIESDRWKNLGNELDQNQCIREKQVVLSELNEYLDTNPLELWEMQNPADLFGIEHPYGHPILGTPRSIANLSIDDAKDFFHTWYQPSNTVICIAGQDKEEAVMSHLQTLWGDHTPVHTPVIRDIPLLHTPKKNKASIHLPNTPPMISWQWLCSTKYTRSAEIIAMLLGSSQYGILHHDLVLNKHWAISVQSFVQEHPSMIVLELRIDLCDESKRERVQAHVQKTMQNIKDHVHSPILNKLRKKIKLQWYMDCEEVESFTEALLCWTLYHDTPFTEHIESYLNITPEELLECMDWIVQAPPLQSHCYATS